MLVSLRMGGQVQRQRTHMMPTGMATTMPNRTGTRARYRWLTRRWPIWSRFCQAQLMTGGPLRRPARGPRRRRARPPSAGRLADAVGAGRRRLRRGPSLPEHRLVRMAVQPGLLGGLDGGPEPLVGGDTQRPALVIDGGRPPGARQHG